MKKYIFSVLFFVAAFFTCVSCYRSLDTIVDTPQNYYLLTLDNQSDVDVIWFVPFHKGGSSTAEQLPESLEGTKNCQFETEAHNRLSVRISQSKGSPFESYKKDDVVPFYVFDAKVFKEESWTGILEGEKWLAKFSYSAKEVIDMDKKIVYKGGE